MTIDFPSCVIRFVDLRSNDEGGDLYAKLNLTAEITTTIRQAMGWGMIERSEGVFEIDENWPPRCEDGSDLLGELNIRTLQFLPTQHGLKGHKISINANVLDSFKWKTVKNKDNSSRSIQIDFIARTSDLDSILKFVGYHGNVAKSPASLVVSYEKQTSLPGMEDGTEVPEASTQETFADV